jgi:hypothetical protein
VPHDLAVDAMPCSALAKPEVKKAMVRVPNDSGLIGRTTIRHLENYADKEMYSYSSESASDLRTLDIWSHVVGPEAGFRDERVGDIVLEFIYYA